MAATISALHDGVAGLKVDLQIPGIDQPGAASRTRAASDYVVLPRIDIDGTHVDLTQRTVLVDAVKVAGGQIHGWLNENGSVNLAELGAAATAAAPTPAPAAPPPGPRGARGAQWTVKVPKIELNGLTVDFQDRSLETGTHVHPGAARHQRGTVAMAVRAAA